MGRYHMGLLKGFGFGCIGLWALMNGWLDGWTNGHEICTFGVCECVVEIIDSDHIDIDILKVE